MQEMLNFNLKVCLHSQVFLVRKKAGFQGVDVVRYFKKLGLYNIVTTLALYCQKVIF